MDQPDFEVMGIDFTVLTTRGRGVVGIDFTPPTTSG